MAISEEYPVGPLRIIIGDADMQRLELPCEDNNYEFYFHEPQEARYKIHGLAHCKIYPPRQLFLPVLPLTLNMKSIFGLCKRCASRNSDKPCQHEDEERAWTTVYTLPEVEYAVRCGYRIKVYEIYSYARTHPVFKAFFEVLASYKIRYEGYSRDCGTEEEQAAFCEWINNHMEFKEEGVRLTPELITNNSALRQMWKLVSISFDV